MTPHQESLPFTVCVCGKLDCTIPRGQCHCGCGAITKLADQTYSRIGVRQGQPNQFIRGHSAVNNQQERIPISYGEVEGEPVVFVPTTKGRTIILDRDAELIYSGPWSVDGNGYANQVDRITKKTVKLHVLIAGQMEDGKTPDHKNGNRLDNRRSNLRPADASEQRWNQDLLPTNKTGVSGVFKKKNGRYSVSITVRGVRKHLGCYVEFEEAVRVRKEAEKLYFGEFTRKPKKED